MYTNLVFLHSFMRWLVLLGLLYMLIRALSGFFGRRRFSTHDNLVRHWSATIAHIQLIIGLLLYFVSPVISFFLHNYRNAVQQREVRFFGMEHSVMMLVAIVLITLGSAKAKRKATDREKFRCILVWYGLALLVILVMVPWPFSPFAARPYLR